MTTLWQNLACMVTWYLHVYCWYNYTGSIWIPNVCMAMNIITNLNSLTGAGYVLIFMIYNTSHALRDYYLAHCSCVMPMWNAIKVWQNDIDLAAVMLITLIVAVYHVVILFLGHFRHIITYIYIFIIYKLVNILLQSIFQWTQDSTILLDCGQSGPVCKGITGLQMLCSTETRDQVNDTHSRGGFLCWVDYKNDELACFDNDSEINDSVTRRNITFTLQDRYEPQTGRHVYYSSAVGNDVTSGLRIGCSNGTNAHYCNVLVIGKCMHKSN